MTRDDCGIRMDFELTNWARIYCGLDAPRCVTASEIIAKRFEPDSRPTPDIKRAEIVNEALARLKHSEDSARHRQWRVLMTRYRSGLMPQEAAKRMKMAQSSYFDAMGKAYRFLDGWMESQHAMFARTPKAG